MEGSAVFLCLLGETDVLSDEAGLQITSLIVGYVFGQGIADIGKEKVKQEQEL